MPRCLIRTEQVRAVAPDGERPVYEIDLAENDQVVRVHQFPLSSAGADPCEWLANVDIVTRNVEASDVD